MRSRGTLTRWDDDRGYGFIKPDEGGPGIFVHIGAMPRGRRPEVGDVVDFTRTTDESGRPRAVGVRRLDGSGRAARGESGPAVTTPRQASPPPTRGVVGPSLVAVAALAAVAGLVGLGAIPLFMLFADLGLSALSFGLYARDKAAARSGTWRVPEASLHLVDLLGGWPGGLVARHVLRHKTHKQPFRRNFWMTAALDVVLLLVLAGSGLGSG